ncbi:MAG: AarF/UbiB family protein [Actinomycetota bacterium]|nr:AarF/UbiB family protein [Actinomycetota bacterium]
MMPQWYALATSMYRDWLDASLAANERWTRGAFEAQKILLGAARRSSEDARESTRAENLSGPALAARARDLSRAQAFLWAAAGFAAGERLGRVAPGEGPGFGAEWLPRAMVIGTVAADLYLGYATLRERLRWTPKLVGEKDWELQHRRGAARVLDTAAALGGTLIKGAQFASTRPDLLPAAYTDTLSSLQDRVPPQTWSVMEPAITQELGRPISEVFAHIEPEPIAAGSIAQVHRARLREGREVAVKVQYPHVADLIEADLSALERTFATLASVEPRVRLQPIADYLRWTLPLELDFEREAASIEDLRTALEDRGDVVVPEVVEGLTTERLLVMELMEGVRITNRDAMLAAGIEPGAVAELLNDAYADQLFNRNILHADPHPGNILVQPGPKLVLLDHGLTLGIDPAFAATLAKMVRFLGEGDLNALAGTLGETGLPIDENTDLDTLLGVVGVLLGTEEFPDDEALDLGNFGRRLGASVGDIPPKLLLVGRAIGLLDGITRQLDPELESLEIVGRYTTEHTGQ